MNKNNFFFVSLIMLTSFCLDAAETIPKITATKVAENIYIIEGSEDHRTMVSDEWAGFSGGNIGLSVGKDGVLIVDAKYAKYSNNVKEAINSIGGDAPKYIVDTHFHGDHVDGNSEFSGQGAVIAHSNARSRIMKEQREEAWPVITFDDEISIHFNGEEIKVLHFPNGHTDGDAVIYFTGSNVAHMGDLYFNGYLPYIDLENGGDVEGYMNNVKSILAQLSDDVKIIPGHGPVASKQRFKNYYRMIQETIGLVTSQMENGKSLDEIKTKGLQKEWAELAWGLVSPNSFIETIYKSYSR